MSNDNVQGGAGNAAESSGNKQIPRQRAGEPISAGKLLRPLADAVNAMTSPLGGGEQVFRRRIGGEGRPKLFRVTANALRTATPPADGEVTCIPIDQAGADIGTSPTDDQDLKKRTDIDLYEDDIVMQTKVGPTKIVSRASGSAEYTQSNNVDLETSSSSSPCTTTSQDTTEWDRESDTEGVTIDWVTSVCFNTTTGDLVYKSRQVDFDRHGILRKIGPEKGTDITTAGCTP